MTALTAGQFREQLVAFGERLCGTLLSLPEVDAVIEREGFEPDEELTDELWMIFAPAASEFGGILDRNELLLTFLSTWAGPYPEEQFLDPGELVDAVSGGAFPEEFLELVESAEEGYMAFEPEEKAAIYGEWGWALADGAAVLTFKTPIDLLEHLERMKR